MLEPSLHLVSLVLADLGKVVDRLAERLVALTTGGKPLARVRRVTFGKRETNREMWTDPSTSSAPFLTLPSVSDRHLTTAATESLARIPPGLCLTMVVIDLRTSTLAFAFLSGSPWATSIWNSLDAGTTWRILPLNRSWILTWNLVSPSCDAQSCNIIQRASCSEQPEEPKSGRTFAIMVGKNSWSS